MVSRGRRQHAREGGGGVDIPYRRVGNYGAERGRKIICKAEGQPSGRRFAPKEMSPVGLWLLESVVVDRRCAVVTSPPKRGAPGVLCLRGVQRL